MSSNNPKIADTLCPVFEIEVQETKKVTVQCVYGGLDVEQLTHHLPAGKRFKAFRVPESGEAFLTYNGYTTAVSGTIRPAREHGNGIRLIVEDIPTPRRITFEYVGHRKAVKGDYFLSEDNHHKNLDQWPAAISSGNEYDIFKLIEDTKYNDAGC